MLILRYFFWGQVYHWASILKINPLSFIVGVVLLPYHVISRLMYPPSQHAEVVAEGIKALKSYWQIPGATLPPKLVRRKFDELEAEVTR